MLALARSKGQYTLDTDACDKQVGCALPHEDEKESNRPVGYWCHTLIDKEMKFDKTHKQWQGVLRTITLLCTYLEGTRFMIWTDYKALRWIRIMTKPTKKLVRRRLRLSEFEFDTVLCAGISHQAADALARLKIKVGTTLRLMIKSHSSPSLKTFSRIRQRLKHTTLTS